MKIERRRFIDNTLLRLSVFRNKEAALFPIPVLLLKRLQKAAAFFVSEIVDAVA